MSTNFDSNSFLSEVTEVTNTPLMVKSLIGKVEPLLISRTNKKRQILPLFGFGDASLLMGFIRTLAQTDVESQQIEDLLGLQRGVLIYLKSNFGNPTFIGSKQVISAIPMNLENVQKCSKYILQKQGCNNFALVDNITQKQVDDYYAFAEERVQRDLEIQQQLKEVLKNQNHTTDSVPFGED